MTTLGERGRADSGDAPRDAGEPGSSSSGASEPARAPVLGRARRLVLALVVALAVAAGLVGRLGLVGGDAIGAADNADGARLFCVAHLSPDAADGRAAWHDVVVTAFRTGGPACPSVAPTTSAGLILRVAVAAAPVLDRSPPAPDGTVRFSLEWLGALYVALLALGVGVAAFAATARRRAAPAGLVLLAVVAPPVAPLLLVPWYSRFLVSTYAEPAGLVGTVWVALGALTLAVTRPVQRAARIAALGLLAVGGVVAATAKPGFLAVGVVALGVVALATVGTSPWRRRLPGLVAALVVVAVAAAPVASALRAQDDYYEVVNAHNLAFAAVLPESGPAATSALGLRPEAWQHSGEGFYFDGGRGVPGWRETVEARPRELRVAAYAWLASHPRVLARLVERGMTATLRPQLPYLVSATSGPRTTVAPAPVLAHPDAPLVMGPLFAYLDAVPARWAPAALVLVAVLAAGATLVAPRAWRRRHGVRSTPACGAVAVGLVRVAAALAVAGFGVVVLAVLGDGFYELPKHVWLGSYALAVAALTAAGSATAAVARVVAARRS